MATTPKPVLKRPGNWKDLAEKLEKGRQGAQAKSNVQVPQGCDLKKKPAISASSPVDFGKVALKAKQPGRKQIVITNTGKAPLTISAIQFAWAEGGKGQFVLGKWKNPLAPGESCQVEVSFQPKHAGKQTAKVWIKSNAWNAQRGWTAVSLLGTGAEVNVVTPVLTPELRVVLYEKGLSAHQAGGETKIYADPTYVEVSLTHAKAEPKYKKGGTLTAQPGNVKFYSDKACTKELAGGALTNAQLTGKDKFKVYLRGTAAGKFKLKLTLEDPADPLIRLGGAAEVDMGVVELGLDLYAFDQSDPPVRTTLADSEKVDPGGLIHTQEKGYHSRAKLVLKKVDPAHWPAGTNAYQVVLSATNASGEAKLWSAERGGSVKGWPVKIRRTNLSADRTYWLEGKTATKALHAIHIDAGVQTKRNGDWVRLTVVQIKEVKPAAADAWNSGQSKYYINLDDDADLATRETNGRTTQIEAQLTEKVQDVPLYFMLAPDKNNRKKANWGIAMPSSWDWNTISNDLKQDDRNPADDKLHRSADTNADGLAEAGLRLSRFGGDRFQAGAFIWEDHHLGKYIPGHPTHGAKKPRLSAPFQVWRKLWYQLTHLKDADIPSEAASVSAYTKVKVDLVAADKAEYESTDAGFPDGTLYADWMVEVGKTGDEVVVIGEHNKTWFYNKFQPDAAQPRKVHIVLCRAQEDPADPASNALATVILPSTFGAKAKALFTWKTPTTDYTSEEIPLSNDVFKPPLQGGDLVVTGTWETVPGGDNGVLAGADILIQRGRKSRRHVRVRLPARATPKVGRSVRVTLELKAADGPYAGESDGPNILTKYYAGDAPRFNDNMVHEIGHAVNQTPESGKQPDFHHIPPHPNWFDRGQGVHCNYDKPRPRGCVMYASYQKRCIHKFCKVCTPYLLVEDMSSFVYADGHRE